MGVGSCFSGMVCDNERRRNNKLAQSKATAQFEGESLGKEECVERTACAAMIAYMPPLPPPRKRTMSGLLRAREIRMTRDPSMRGRKNSEKGQKHSTPLRIIFFSLTHFVFSFRCRLDCERNRAQRAELFHVYNFRRIVGPADPCAPFLDRS